MKNVNVFLLLSFFLLGIAFPGHSVRYHYYAGASLGAQSQRYNLKINDAQNGRVHNVDAARFAPEAGLLTGARVRFQNKFFGGLELGATFFPSEVKRNINSSATKYKVTNSFYAINLSLMFGFLFQKIDTLMYLKLGGESRNIRAEMSAGGNSTEIKSSKRSYGFLAGAGVELPLANSVYLGAEGIFRFYQNLKVKGNGNNNNLNATIKPSFDSFNLKLIYQMGNR